MAAPHSLPPNAGPSPEADAYSELLSRTRDLHAEQRAARDRWYAALAVPDKEELLFEFEVLLKATACFANPRNHPGPPRKTAIVAYDFRSSLAVLRDGLQRAVELCRQLLGSRERTLIFHRYLETVLPEDNLRARLAGEGLSQATPTDSLVALRHALSNTVEVVQGLLRASQIPYRLFYAAHTLVQREIGRNTYFNPLTALEFRPEFDRLQSPEVLRLIHTVPPGEAHRLVALTFLALFRMMRYLRLLSSYSAESRQSTRTAGRAYFVLSVLRSDARALSDYLQKHSGRLLAESFRREIWTVTATQICESSARLRTHSHRLIAIKSALECVASNLRLEMRRTFQHDFPVPDTHLPEQEFRDLTEQAVLGLRPALRNSILFLGKTLGTNLEAEGVFNDHLAKVENSDRLRRDVWMFSQIVRAFFSKAQHSSPEDRWGPVNEFQYVREFLGYFRSMGYPLLRAADYPRFDRFMSAMSELTDTELVDPLILDRAISECIAFHEFLETLFQQISRREELANSPFDRRRAAGALRLYLGDATE
ncbi:MAG: hypothetical protein RJA70_11 [Pseudomonadota bacterium]|jgi:hypothetical protein